MPDERRYYINDTGTGNTLNLSHQRVLQMVTDSLRYWVQEMHVDGFRFDLGTILAREPYGFDEGGGFLDACGRIPVLSSVKLIAEPWDCGPGGYQVGRFLQAGQSGTIATVTLCAPIGRAMTALCRISPRASPDQATSSIDAAENLGRASISSRHTTASPSTTSFPTTTSTTKRTARITATAIRNNRSWNHGVEGPTDDPEIIELRERQKRNILATLLLSQGTPMLLAGDEFGRSQQGNNNAYCQDNEVSWVDWDHDERAQALTRFVRRLTHLRDLYPVLRQSRFVTGAGNEQLEIRDCTWLTPANEEMAEAHWAEPAAKCLGLLLDGTSANERDR